MVPKAENLGEEFIPESLGGGGRRVGVERDMMWTGIAVSAMTLVPVTTQTLGSSRNRGELCDFAIEFPVIPRTIQCHFWALP